MAARPEGVGTRVAVTLLLVAVARTVGAVNEGVEVSRFVNHDTTRSHEVSEVFFNHTTAPREPPKGVLSNARSARSCTTPPGETSTAGPTEGPVAASRLLILRSCTGRSSFSPAPLQTPHACWAPEESSATAIEAGQSPVPVLPRSRPSVTEPVDRVCQPPPASRQASCTPLEWRPWSVSSLPLSVFARRWFDG
jgi:hypothetical protein